jgi:hypothetical protein
MLLHLDGSSHAWFHDDRRYDLLVILDDATSEIYYAQLVPDPNVLTSANVLQNHLAFNMGRWQDLFKIKDQIVLLSLYARNFSLLIMELSLHFQATLLNDDG